MDGDDRDLLERIQHGDAESFGILYDRTRRWLLDCVITPQVGRVDAEDVLAETYHVALAKIHRFRWRGTALLHWLAAIARRKALEHRRRRNPRVAAMGDLAEMLEIPDDVPTAEAELIRREQIADLRERVTRTLACLPARYAEALRLRLLEDRPRPQCAEALEVSVATFDVVLYRATRAFLRHWSKP